MMMETSTSRGLKYMQLSAVNALSPPINVILGPANEHDSFKEALSSTVMNDISIASGAHRPKKRPKHVFADPSYDTVPCRALSFKEKDQSSDSKKEAGKKHARRPFVYDKEAYKKKIEALSRDSLDGSREDFIDWK
jgi:hypothetical protein